MKKTLSMMAVALLMSAVTMAGDLKVLVVKTTPAVQNVEAKTKVRNVLWLRPGVKKVEAVFADQQVLVTYDSAKTNQKKIVAALTKAGYETTVVSDTVSTGKKQVPGDATSGATHQVN